MIGTREAYERQARDSRAGGICFGGQGTYIFTVRKHEIRSWVSYENESCNWKLNKIGTLK